MAEKLLAMLKEFILTVIKEPGGMLYLWFVTIVVVFLLPIFFPNVIKNGIAADLRAICLYAFGAAVILCVWKKRR